MMVNEINGLGSAATRIGNGESKPAAAAPRPEGSKSNADSVNVSESVRTLQQAETAAKAAPEIDAERVDAIRSAIIEGRYPVDVDALTERLLEDEALLS